MPDKTRFQLEYIIKSSPSILYTFVSSPSALAQWFADSVDSVKDEYTFIWDGNVEHARVVEEKEFEFIRYKWENSKEDEYFEFKVEKDDITGDTALIITDFASEDEMEDQKLLWDSQVKALVGRIGG